MAEGKAEKAEKAGRVPVDGALPVVLRRLGVTGGELAGELVRILPEAFVERYSLLWLKGVGSDGVRSADVGKVGAVRKTRLTTGQTETRGGAKSGKKMAGASTKVVVKDERALAMKAKVDRKLRAIGRDIGKVLAEKDGLTGRVRRCTRCRKYAEDNWSYCPWDGAVTEEVD